MASIDRKSKRNAVDASCEIVIDALYMTSDILHSITNNLPIPMEAAQVVNRSASERPELPNAKNVKLAMMVLLGVVAMMVGAVQIAGAVSTPAWTQASSKAAQPGIIAPTPGEEARALLDSGDPNRALASVEFAAAQGLVDADLRLVKVEALLAMGEFSQARTEALRGAADGLGPQFVSLYRESLRADPALAYDPQPLQVAAIQKTERRGDALRVELDGIARNLHVATLEDNTWASQVAAARLCIAIDCAFEMPVTEHVTLTRSDALALGLDLDTLDWRFGVDVSGEFVEVVDASLTEVVDTPANFPIEYTRTWRNALSVTVDESHVDAPFAATIHPLAEQGSWARDVLAHRGEAGTRHFARQVGSMIAFDFLTNHYARFESAEARYGAHVGWLDGELISTDHTQAFAERSSRRASDRFHWMTRMPVETATAVRLMAPEVVDEEILVGLNDRQREVFWEQQGEFVRRLDSLEAQHGTSRVLAL